MERVIYIDSSYRFNIETNRYLKLQYLLSFKGMSLHKYMLEECVILLRSTVAESLVRNYYITMAKCLKNKPNIVRVKV